jgi:hypothetical protein
MAEGQRLTIAERARRYLAKMDAPRRDPADPQDSHAQVFSAAIALYHGFSLDESQALSLLAEYCQRSDRPWTEAELRHKVRGAVTATQAKQRGHLLNGARPEDFVVKPIPNNVVPFERPEFDARKLRDMAGKWREVVDLVWLANRSSFDPAQVTAGAFLQALYPGTEQVLLFTTWKSQGQALWPQDKVPIEGPEGVWFLAQPIDGQYHPNPRNLDKDGNPKMSRRSEESVTAFRYLVLESDTADMRDWLGLLVQIPLRIEAIYTSGGRSIHVLVRVNCPTRRAWDEERKAMEPTLNLLHLGGNDAGALSCVRLTRLPGAMRNGKRDKADRYVKFAEPALQKLLYLRPNAPLRALKDLLPTRDVEGFWCGLAKVGVGDADEGEGSAWLLNGLNYYANVSARVRESLVALKSAMEVEA